MSVSPLMVVVTATRLSRSLGGKGAAIADDGARAGPERQEDPFGDAGNTAYLFDKFQSAPAVSLKAESTPPATATDWNLDFLVVVASKEGGTVKSLAGLWASVMSGASADVIKSR